MKTLFVLALLSLGMTQNASAFYVQADVAVNSNFVSAQVCNYGYSSVMQCRVRAIGQVQNGALINAWANLTLAPGQCDFAYVYANYPFYFVNGNGDAQCRLVAGY